MFTLTREKNILCTFMRLNVFQPRSGMSHRDGGHHHYVLWNTFDNDPCCSLIDNGEVARLCCIPATLTRVRIYRRRWPVFDLVNVINYCSWGRYARNVLKSMPAYCVVIIRFEHYIIDYSHLPIVANFNHGIRCHQLQQLSQLAGPCLWIRHEMKKLRRCKHCYLSVMLGR